MFSCEASSEAATGGDGANSLMLSFNGYWDGDDGDDDGDDDGGDEEDDHCVGDGDNEQPVIKW